MRKLNDLENPDANETSSHLPVHQLFTVDLYANSGLWQLMSHNGTV